MRALLAIALFLGSALPAWCADALVLQSSRDHAYSEAVRGFRASYPGSLRVVVLRDYAEIDPVRLVQEERPRVVLAVGERALALAKRLRDVEVVALLAPSFEQKRAPANLADIAIAAAPERYLRLFRSLGKKRIGVLYDPARTGCYLGLAVRLSREFGLTLEHCEVHNTLQAQAALSRLKGKVDLLWLLPDSTVLSATNVEAFLVFAMENKIPLVSYLEQHLKSGAAATLDIDPYDIGKQAGELCAVAPEGGGLARGSLVYPRKAQLHVNASVLRKLGLAVPLP